MREQQEETHVLVAVACAVVYQNLEALSMTETWTKQILHYSHFQIKKKSRLFTSLGVMKYTSLEEKVGNRFTITKSTEVCELHVKPDELGQGIETLKAGVEVPSVYSFEK